MDLKKFLIVILTLYLVFIAVGFYAAGTGNPAILEETPTESVLVDIEEITKPETEPVTEQPTEAETEPPTEPPKTYTEEDVEMLACVIYQEAGGDACCDNCRRRVADVVLNRVADWRYPDTIYEVLTEPYQYGRLHWTGIVWPERAQYSVEAHAVERAYRIAREVLEGHHSDVYGKGFCGQAEYSVFKENWDGNEYINHCGGLYFFTV